MKRILLAMCLTLLLSFIHVRAQPLQLDSTTKSIDINIDTIDIFVDVLIDPLPYPEENKEMLVLMNQQLEESASTDSNTNALIESFIGILPEILDEQERGFTSKLDYLEQNYSYTKEDIRKITKRRTNIQLYSLLLSIILMLLAMYRLIMVTRCNRNAVVLNSTFITTVIMIIIICGILGIGLNALLQVIFNSEWSQLKYLLTLSA